LDNVIDINTLPIKQAELTNQKYRAIGLGSFGWHHLLALKNIEWETEEAVTFADDLYEKIAYLTIKSSMELAHEKGSYPHFEGSKLKSGEYFDVRGYKDEKWLQLKQDVAKYGMRNGYLLAVAPNSSTAMIAGSTASIDPIFKPFYSEETNDFRLPKVAPDMTPETYNIYRRSEYSVALRWSVKQNAARQEHIDQCISFIFYVRNTIRA